MRQRASERARTALRTSYRALLQMPRWNFNEILSDVSVNLIKRSSDADCCRDSRAARVALESVCGVHTPEPA